MLSRLILFILCALALPGVARAQTSCSATNRYGFDFGAQPAATLNYATIYNYTATNGAGGAQAFSMSFATNGTTSTMVAGNQMPAISTLINDGAGRSLVIGGIFGGRTTDIFSATRTIQTIFAFPVPIRELTFTVHDVDFANNQYRDWFAISGTNGAASYTPVMTTPFGTINTVAGPRSNASSSLRLGPETTPFNVNVSAAIGTSLSAADANTGNVTVVFAQPVTQVTLRYGNYPFSAGENATGQQAYGVDGLYFCPMPNVTVDKSSTPFITAAGDPGRFAIPLADIAYTLTITNSGGSTVDLASTNLADILPPNVTFFNGDYDGAGPGTTNFEFAPGTSGLTLGAANVTYSNNAGSTYVYNPAVGYDAAVDAVRFVPQGTMAANSSFTIRFRARIN